MTRTAFRTVEIVAGLLVVALLAGQFLGQPLLLGFVQTDSMQPALEPGDGFVALPPQLVGPVEHGDVVTFDAATLDGGGLTTHRVVGQREGGFVTRGDGNSFTDQQGEEPPVPRERIVAVALQVNGGVVAIPGLGTFVGEAQALIVTAGGLLNLHGSPQTLATLLLALLGIVYLVDELLAAPERTERTNRASTRESGYSTRRLVFVGAGIIVLVATVSMVSATGTTTVEFGSTTEGQLTQGTPGGDPSLSTPLQFSNDGLVPTVAVIQSRTSDVSMSKEALVVGPGEQASVNATLTTPAEATGADRRIVQHSYIGVVPVSVLTALHALHPWVAIAAVDLFLWIVLVTAGYVLLGRRRLRFREGRGFGTVTLVRRILRQRYQ
jgi:signal peptidase